MCGSGRRASSVSEVAAAVTEAAMAGVIASSSAQTDSSLGDLSSSGTAGAAPQDSATTADANDNSAAGTSAHEKASEQDVRQDVGMDTDQMAMRIALDVLWTGGGSGAAPGLQTSQPSDGTES